MKLASIDIGTNTMLLYMAEYDKVSQTVRSLLNVSRVPRIGKGVAETGEISNEKSALLCDILNEFKDICLQNGCSEISAFCTYPFRTALNAGEVRTKALTLTGIDIETITANDEALWSYIGATAKTPPDIACAVIDIGGGSTEISIGRDRVLQFTNSIECGAVNQTEQLIGKTPIHKDKLLAARSAIFKKIRKGFSFRGEFEKCYAIAGTPTTLAVMKNGLTENEEEKTDQSILTSDDVEYYINQLADLAPETIEKKFGSITFGRSDVLLAGACILYSIMQHFHLSSVTVSYNGLRHGAVLHRLFKTFGKYFELLC